MYTGLLFHFEISQHRPYHKRGEEYRPFIVFHLNECLQVETDSKIQGGDMEFILLIILFFWLGEGKTTVSLVILCLPCVFMFYFVFAQFAHSGVY